MSSAATACPIPKCRRPLRTEGRPGATLYTALRSLLTNHMRFVHPGLRPRKQSLLLDEAMETAVFRDDSPQAEVRQLRWAKGG